MAKKPLSKNTQPITLKAPKEEFVVRFAEIKVDTSLNLSIINLNQLF